MATRKLIEILASRIKARQNCAESQNAEWYEKHSEVIDKITKMLPSGSGLDNGSVIDKTSSNDKKIIIRTSFHHMDENGFYDGWTDHCLTITPTFAGIDIKVSGSNRNDIKEYIADCFYEVLMSDVLHDFGG